MSNGELTGRVIGAAIEVHRVLGPGLLESAYRDCLVHELKLSGIGAECEVPIAVKYKGLVVHPAYRADVLVENELLLELKTVDHVEPVHKAQLLTYLRLSRRKLGLLINFKVPVLRNGIYRVAN